MRTEAAYALAQWQNSHAPRLPPTSSSTQLPGQDRRNGSVTGSAVRANIYEWAAMEVLLGCIRGMFMETVRVALAPKAILTTNTKIPSVPSFLPLPNCFEDNTKTVLRSALLVSLASIKAGNGATPEEIIEELLNFAENNDNTPNQPQSTGDKAVPKSQVCTGRSYDDSMYCSLLLYCLSMIVTSNSELLLRIIDCAKYYLDRERIVASSMYEAETEWNKGLFKTPGELLTATSGKFERSGGNLEAKNGIVTAMALQCICNMEMQLDTAGVSVDLGVDMGSDNLTTSSSCTRKYAVFCYKGYLNTHNGRDGSSTSNLPIVRASALDCSIRLALAKYAARLHEQITMEDPHRKKHNSTTLVGNGQTVSHHDPQHAYSVKKSNVLSDCVSLTLQVVSSDPSRYVRRSAAMSLLLALQVCDVCNCIYNTLTFSLNCNAINA